MSISTSIIISLCAALLCVSSPVDAATLWHTDYSQVRTLSQQDNKPVLLFFNGSDWSGEAMWMKHEVLVTKPFEEKIVGHFICMEADFPQHSQLAEHLAAQNQALKQRFLVQQTPTLLLLDHQERVIAHICYVPENGNQFANDLLRLLQQDVTLVKGLASLDHQNAGELITLYQIAQELGREPAQEQILEAGLKNPELKNQDPYFFLEKYRLLVERGEKEPGKKRALREKLASLDPENTQGVHFTLALIDFQDLSQKKQNPESAVAPLVAYIGRFGSKDPQNLWRIEMMIAQHYMEADLQDKALQHAEKALQAAPDRMHEEIAHSLDYIRSTSSPQ